MAINSQIPLLGQTPDYSQIGQNILRTAATLGQLQQAEQEAPLRQALLQAQIDEIPARQEARRLEQEYSREQLDAFRNDNKLKGGVYAAVQGRALLDNGDIPGFMELAQTRVQNVSSRGGDPSGTLKAVELVQSGDLDGARQLMDRQIQIGEQLGIIQREKPLNANTSTAYNDGLALGLQGDELKSYVRERTAPNGGSTTPYYQFLPTSSGYAVGNARTGQIVAPGAQGPALLPIAADVDLATTKAGGEAAGKSAIDASNEAIKGLAVARTTMANMDDAIRAIDEGADSGAIASRLPSITKSSIELDNARSRLGLNVVQGTTFGALSEGELRLALDTGLPSNLDQKDLRSWIVRKKAAQEKLAGELESAAIYLGKPGNTPAGYLEMRRNERRQRDDDTLEIDGVTIRRVK